MAQIIQLLQQLKMSSALQDARQAMHALFPLTEEMWLSWIQDQQTGSESKQLQALCAEAVLDYLSVPLWEHRIRYSEYCHLYWCC